MSSCQGLDAFNLIFCISFENTPIVFVAYWKNNPTAATCHWRKESGMQMRPIDKCRRLTRLALARFRLNEICSAYVHKTPDLSFPTQRETRITCLACVHSALPPREICGEIRRSNAQSLLLSSREIIYHHLNIQNRRKPQYKTINEGAMLRAGLTICVHQNI